MAVQEEISRQDNRHNTSFDESQAIKDIINNTNEHPIDDFITEMAEKEWDLSSTGSVDFDLASLPPISDLPPPPTNDKSLVATKQPTSRPTHKRSVTLDESMLPELTAAPAPPAVKEVSSPTTLTAEDFNIVAASLIDVEPTPVSVLMKEDPIPLYIPPSPPSSAVVAPSPPPFTLPDEMPVATAAPVAPSSSTVINAGLPAFAPFVASSKTTTVAASTAGAPPAVVTPTNAPIAAPQLHPVHSRVVVPARPIPKARRGRTKRTSQPLYVEPTNLDCLLGRGGRSNHHPGNKRYLAEVKKLQRWYKSSGKSEKTDLSQCLVNYVHNYGGRFLRLEKSTGRWYVVSNLVARKKASQALREHLSPEERAAKKAQLLEKQQQQSASQ